MKKNFLISAALFCLLLHCYPQEDSAELINMQTETMLQQHISFEQTNDRAQQILGRINIVAKQWYDKDNNGNAQMRCKIG